MDNFTYCNPVKIVFGKNTISQLNQLIDPKAKILLTYGGGSIKKNGVYRQVKAALKKRKVVEFGGIEPNPTYETCLKAIALGRKEKINFVLAVGGGSVLDGSKFIAAGIPYKGKNLWDIVSSFGQILKTVIPIGTVITLPATGSEMNAFGVISRLSTTEKLAFGSPLCYPKFSILDPQTTYSLDKKQLRNGIVDTFVHVAEQYATVDLNTALQDKYAEAIFKTLIEIAPAVMSGKKNYDARANFMWCATQALCGILGCGIKQDWSTHGIGHELTAFFGPAHAETLAIVLPAMWKYEIKNKSAKFAKLAENVWGVKKGTAKQKANAAIKHTVKFFHSLGMPTSLKNYGITSKDIEKIVQRFADRGMVIGENGDIDSKAVRKILKLSL
ncbi:MAG: iron-containing alcohol dehydrogenase [Phycisphaerae bacterium]|jgi:NADP-dependent alcohol dehydrogenase